jgi:Domain of unknown function (DUF3471)
VQRDWVALYGQAFEAWLKEYFGGRVDYSKPPAQPSPPLPDSAYAGTYRSDFFGEIQIVEKDGGFVLQQGPAKIVSPLRHFDRDLFVYQPVGESAGGLSGVAFPVGPDQSATSVVIENLDIFGQGTFTRVPAGN